MERPLEKLETKRLRDDILAEYPNAHVMKVHGSVYGQSGTPDLLVIVKGVYRWVEVKVGRGKLSALQMATIGDIVNAGGIVQVFTVRKCDPGTLWEAEVTGYDRFGDSWTGKIVRERGGRWPVHVILGIGSPERKDLQK